MLQSSQQLGGPGWGVANAFWTPNGSTAPNGTQTAALVTANNGATDAYAIDYVPNPSLYDNQTVTGSVYLRVPPGQPSLATYLFLPNQTDDAGFSAPIQPITVSSTWTRFSITATLKNGLTMLGMQVAGGGTFTSNKQAQVWGAQLVVGSSPGVYEPTSSSTINYSTGQSATLAANGLNDAYGYDSFGNITRFNGSTPGYYATNRLAGWPYDAAGNMLTNGLVPLTWDAESRITSAGGSSYLYDAMGQRVESSGSGVTDSVYFGGRPVARLQSGQWTDLIYGPTGLVAEVGGQENADPRYRLVDHLGTLVGTTNSSTLLQNPLDYNPFGAIRTGSANDPFVFTGKERDAESGLDYFGARYYGSNMGRFMSPDLVNVTEDRMVNPSSTLNKYAYAANSPLKYVDSDGQDITVFYDNGGPGGHAVLLAYDTNTHQAAVNSFGPDHARANRLATFVGWPVAGQDHYGFEDIHSPDDLRRKYASITIQTSPEITQQVISYINSHPGGSYATYTHNCTTTCAKILREFGLYDYMPIVPLALFDTLVGQYNKSLQHQQCCKSYQPGRDYGHKRPGYDPFILLFQSMNGSSGGDSNVDGPDGGAAPSAKRNWWPFNRQR